MVANLIDPKMAYAFCDEEQTVPHEWKIAAAAGRTSAGRCKKCHAVKDWPNSMEAHNFDISKRDQKDDDFPSMNTIV